jgi:hypothetical protein
MPPVPNPSWLLSRVQQAAAAASGGLKKAAALRPPPPPPPLPAAMLAKRMADLAPPLPPTRSVELPLPSPRYPSGSGDYYDEWNRFIDAGVPNEYRTYGPGAGKPEILSVFREMAPDLGPNDLHYLRRPMVEGTRITPGTYGVASRRMNRAGDVEQRFQVYGVDNAGRRAVLYSVPLEEAQAMGLEEKLRSLGYMSQDTNP